MTVAERLLVDTTALFLDGRAWLAFGVSGLALCLALAVGIAVGTRVGVLTERTPVPTLMGVGLTLGLTMLVAAYATVRSGASSVFVPAALLLGAAVLAGTGRTSLGLRRKGLVAAALASWILSGSFALLFGATIAPSPRDGVQPVEFMDEAYYAVLGTNLRDTGRESLYASAGFGDLPGQPSVSWYHWGETWLAAAAQNVPGVTAMHARHVVALPLVMVAAIWSTCALAVAFVRRARRREAIVLAAAGSLLVAPVPLWLEYHFDWWARAMPFSVTLYGLAYPLVPASTLIFMGTRRPSRPASLLAAGLGAALVCSHVVVAAVAFVACLAGLIWRACLQPARIPAGWGWAIPPAAALASGLITVVWGLVTGHGFGGDGRVVGVSPFDDAWRRAIVWATLGSAALAVGPLVLLLRRQSQSVASSLGIAAWFAAVTGATVWGFRLPDFNAFHAFFGALAVIVTPIAVTGIVRAAMRARDLSHRGTAVALVVLLLAQSAVGLGATLQRLYEFGPGHYKALPVAALDLIRTLPPDAKLAYACANFEEVATWDARLISITAHTGRAVVPMCFQADIIGPQLMVEPDPRVPNPFFLAAPQRALYPTVDAKPSTTQVIEFLDSHGIGYIWEDPDHPNILVPNAALLFRDGSMAIYGVP